MPNPTIAHLIEQLDLIDRTAREIAPTIGTLNGAGVLGHGSLGSLSCLQMHIDALRRQVRESGALTVARVA